MGTMSLFGGSAAPSASANAMLPPQARAQSRPYPANWQQQQQQQPMPASSGRYGAGPQGAPADAYEVDPMYHAGPVYQRGPRSEHGYGMYDYAGYPAAALPPREMGMARHMAQQPYPPMQAPMQMHPSAAYGRGRGGHARGRGGAGGGRMGSDSSFGSYNGMEHGVGGGQMKRNVNRKTWAQLLVRVACRLVW